MKMVCKVSMRSMWIIIIAVALGALAVFAVACGDDDGSGPKMKATLKDFSIALDRGDLAAGKVAITAKNEGKEKHELIALRTDLPMDKFPVVDGKVDENKLEGTDEIDALDPGKSETKTFDLPAGRYVFYCNQPKHYEQGMRTELIVR